MSEWDARFARFVERKTRAALDARLEPFTTELDRAAPAHVAIGNAWTRTLFDGPFYVAPADGPISNDQRPTTNDDRPTTNDQRPTTSLVFVQSRDGNTVAANPSVLGGGETDKHLIYEGLSRVAADAVLAGAETVRGTDIVLSVWHPELVALRAALGLPRHAIQIVASLRGLDIAAGLMFNLPEVPVAIITVPAGERTMRRSLDERPWIQCIVMQGAGDLAAAFRALRARGIRRISAIGGRTFATAAIDAGLVDELYLTTSSTTAGEPHTPLYRTELRGEAIVRKRGTGADAGVVFDHIVL